MQKVSQKFTFSPKLQFVIFGIASTAWFLIRVVPKPSRAGYPCMRAAAPFASAFVLYLITVTSSVFFFRRTGNYLKSGNIRLASLFLVLGIGASIVALTHRNSAASAAETPLEGTNLPKGIAKGIYPGRVVWVYDTAATNKNCTNAFGDGYFLDSNTNQNEVDRMLETAVKELTGQSNLTGAWDAIFKYHNQTRGKGNTGYNSNEAIFLKINATSTWSENINSSYGRNNNGYYAISETSPQVVLAVLRQLVNTAGVPESKIYVGDPLKHIYQDNYTKWHNEFPNVHYLDHSSASNGREKVVKSSSAVVRYSDRGTVLKTTTGNAVYTDSLYTIFETMEYMINIPNLKAHEYGGVSMFGKNHFGSQTRDNASHLHSGLVSNGTALRNTYKQYRVQVDLMTHQLLGKKNLFYLMDALYCSDKSVTKPSKWQIAPFNNDWTSSLFLSQDPVAIESVGFDFLYAQYTGADGNNSYPHMGAVDDYLHQLADSTQWPTGITYDPDNDGKSIGYSQGVHEHWNNSTDKKYSRNLGTGSGIELIQDFLSPEAVSVTGVSLSSASLSLSIGSTSTLRATVSPSDATIQSVRWSSNNTSVATVSSSGVVTAIAAGNATITVTTVDGNKTASCIVTTENTVAPATSIYVDFGPNDGTNGNITSSPDVNGNYWNNITNTSTSSSAVNLVDSKNVSTGAYITITSAFSSNGIQNGGLLSPNTSLLGDLAINKATQDYFYTGSSGSFTINGLDKTQGYVFYLFGTRNDVETRITTYTLQGSNTYSGTLQTSGSNLGGTGYNGNTKTILASDVVTPSSSGQIKVTVTKTSGSYGYLGVMKIKKAIPVTGVSLSSTSLAMTVGSTTTLTATVSPSNSTVQTVIWSSNNTSIATVSTNGVVTAVAGGNAIITVTTADGSKTATCAVTVTVPVTGITLTPTSLSLTVNNTSALTATLSPSNATNKAVSWTSNNTSVASVNSNGVITAVAPGNATLMATTVDGSKTATCAVSILSPISVTGVSLNTNSLSLTTGSSSTLVATISPSNATNPNVSWASGNTSVATVNSNGEVTAIAAGTANIIVTTVDGSKTATCTVLVLANLALNKSVYSSSDESTELTANYATDGTYGSRWSSAFSDPQWIYVDLGATYKLTRVKLYWEAAYGTTYKIQVSNDTSNWTDVYSTTTGDGDTDDLSILSSNGRYVKMYGTARATPYGYSLYEFEVYGDTIDAQAPNAPTGLTSPSQTQTSISLAWNASTDNLGVSGYDIYKNEAYATSTAGTSCTISGLTAGSAYTFTVKAKDATGNYSAASSAITISTLSIPVTGVTLSSTSLSLTAGSTAALTATVTPSDATNRAVTWSSSNTSVATVNNVGLVTAIAGGSTTITAVTADGSKSATCPITVTISVTGVSLNSTSLSLLVGNTSSLTATIFPSNATNQTVTWSSDNTSVATVTNNGTITAVAGGSATIKVTTTDGSKTATCVVNVIVPVTGVSLSSKSLSLIVGGTSTLTAAVLPSDATDQMMSWSSSNTSVAKVNSNGIVAALADGSAIITATTTDGSKTDTCVVNVTSPIPVSDILLNVPSLNLFAGNTSTLTATISPSNATNQAVNWSSNNTSVAIVNSAGVVTAIAEGSSTITVTTVDGSKTATCAVAVTVPVTSVALNTESLLLGIGSTSKLSATISPSNATNKTVSWTSGDTSVAIVNSNGSVTAISVGNASITATTADGSKTASCAVTVNSSIPVTGVELNTSFLAIGSCQSSALTATVSPSDATNTAVSWSSDNINVATVSSSGEIKGIAVGTANITVSTIDGNKTAICKVSVISQTLTGIVSGVSGTINCKSSSIALSGLTGSYKNYKWIGPNSYTSTSKSPSVSTPGIYTLTATDTMNNCTVTAITNVLQNTSKPIARASANGTLSCGTKSVNLKVATSTPNTVITWDGQSAGTNPVSMQWPGKYFVTTKDTVNGCTKRDSVIVNQYITYNSTQFYNNTFSSYANGTIADNNTNGWTLDRSKIPSATTTYGSNTTPHYFAVYSKRLTAQQLGGEGIFYSKVINVSGKPNFQIGVNIATEGTMTSSDYVKLYYKLDGGSEIAWANKTGAFSQDFRSPLLNANTVQIVVKVYSTVKGNTSVSNHYILQYQLYIQDCGYPMVVYSSATGEINCDNQSVTLQANSSHAGAIYKWSGPNSFSSTAQYPVVSTPGTYTVTASMPATANSSVISATATGTVTVTQNITAPVAMVGTPDTLSFQTKFVSLSGSSSTSGVTYKWTGPNGFISNSQSPFTTSPGTYTLSVSSPANGCTSSVSTNVVQNVSKSAMWLPEVTISMENSLERVQPVFELYPNPVYDELYFKCEGNGNIVSLKIFGLRGEVIIPSFGKELSSIDVSKLGSGLYILIAETENGTFKRKFIKQ